MTDQELLGRIALEGALIDRLPSSADLDELSYSTVSERAVRRLTNDHPLLETLAREATRSSVKTIAVKKLREAMLHA